MLNGSEEGFSDFLAMLNGGLKPGTRNDLPTLLTFCS